MKATVFERYAAAVAEWAAEEARGVEAARLTGDERKISLAQMRKSLLDLPNGMVAAVGRMNEAAFQRVRAEVEQRIEARRAAQDFDAVERGEIQLSYLNRARALYMQLEADQ